LYDVEALPMSFQGEAPIGWASLKAPQIASVDLL
jgi:hypothetical protein